MRDRQKGIFIMTESSQRQKAMHSGVYKKIMTQYEVFSNNFEMKMMDRSYRTSFIRNVLTRVPFFPYRFAFSYKEVPDGTDFLYIRLGSIIIDRQTVQFCKNIKKQQPQCKIIVEFTTSPDDIRVVFRKIHHIPVLLKNAVNRNQLHKYVDRCVVYGTKTELLQIPAIVTENGIDTSSVAKREPVDTGNTLNILSVSSMLKWHGLDRVIRGIKEYYCNGGLQDIKLHLAGTGPELTNLQETVKESGLENKVVFYGWVDKEDLNKLYNICDLALEMLPCYKKESSSLKSREYISKGIPFVASTSISFPDPAINSYILKVPADESNIDICECIDFCNKIYGKKREKRQEVINEMHDYAEKFFDIKITMKPIMDYIKSEDK